MFATVGQSPALGWLPTEVDCRLQWLPPNQRSVVQGGPTTTRVFDVMDCLRTEYAMLLYSSRVPFPSSNYDRRRGTRWIRTTLRFSPRRDPQMKDLKILRWRTFPTSLGGGASAKGAKSKMLNWLVRWTTFSRERCCGWGEHPIAPAPSEAHTVVS